MALEVLPHYDLGLLFFLVTPRVGLDIALRATFRSPPGPCGVTRSLLGLVSHFLDTEPVLSLSGFALVHSDLGLSDGSPAHAGGLPLSGVVGCCAPTALLARTAGEALGVVSRQPWTRELLTQ
jgi:hypothetical protein